MHSSSHEVALEGIEINDMRTECVEILSSGDIRAGMTGLYVWTAERRERHKVVVIPISAILGHSVRSVVLGTRKQIHDMKECRGPIGDVGTSVR
jgi:hypothetical protein